MSTRWQNGSAAYSLAEQLLVTVNGCGVCRTDLHIMDSELTHPKLPMIPGHEIVGTVARVGAAVTTLKAGTLVGITWLAYTCGHCRYCLRQQENLCEIGLFKRNTKDGGYAEYTVAYSDYCFSLAYMYGKPSGAPLLCAGLIGFRAYSMIGSHVEHLGIYEFAAAAHILIQVALHQGGSEESPPEHLDAAIILHQRVS